MVDTHPVLSEFSDKLDVLAHPERLTLLLALRDTPPDESVQRTGDERDHPSAERVQQVRMYHVHLPKLDDHGVIDWDRETDAVRRGADFEAVEPILDALGPRRDALLADAGYQ